MKKFLKKYWWVLALVAALVAWNVYLLKNSKTLAAVKVGLEKKNQTINLALKKSNATEAALNEEIKIKVAQVTALDTRLTSALSLNEQLQKKLTNQPKAENPKTFLDLQECQEKYSILAASLNICITANEKGQNALNLCLDKNVKQAELIQLSELNYLNCQEQVRLTGEKLINTEAALVQLDRDWKKRTFLKNVKNYAIGAFVGAVIVYILKKNKR